MWPMIAMAGLQAAQGLLGGYSAEAQAAVQNTLNKANADATNKVRGARNTLAVAKGRLARANQIESNRRILAQGNRQRDASMVNYLRMRDASTTADFEGQIQMAEQAGAAAAAQALSGVTGSVVDMVNTTTRLRNARTQAAIKQRDKSLSMDAANEQANIQRATIESLDTSSIMDELDYNVDFAMTVSRQGNWFTDIAPAISTLGQAFSGPTSKPSAKTSFSYANPPNSAVMLK